MTEYNKPCPKCGNNQLTMIYNSGKISSLGTASMDYKCGSCSTIVTISAQFGDNHFLVELSMKEKTQLD